ncbi:MAG TPA: hypothetical protein VGH28_21505 [Polyangiaceae bacterium]|jgi:hypothetical protein
MTLNLSTQDLSLLKKHLGRELAHVEQELVHTDKFELQHELAAELAKLRAIFEKIDVASGDAQVLGNGSRRA